MHKRTSLSVLAVLVLSFAATACGGEKKPAHSPESGAAITETAAKEDMPAPPTEKADVPVADTTTPSAGAAGGVIKVVAMKITPTMAKASKSKAKTIELKDDGTVTIEGKPAAKFKGDQVDSNGGTSMVTVGVDGSLVGNGVKPGFKFEGDELAGENGMKLSVGDDGTITATKDGKSQTIAMAEGGAGAKRAALIATVLWLPMDAGAKPAKPTAAAAKAAPAK